MFSAARRAACKISLDCSMRLIGYPPERHGG